MTDLTDFASGLVLGGILGRCRWAAMRDALLLPLPPAPPTYQGRTVRGQPLICPSPATIAECGGPCEWGFEHCDCGLLQKLRRSEPDELFIRMDEGRIQRGNGNGNGNPTTPKPGIIPKPQPAGGHLIIEGRLFGGYQPRPQQGTPNPPPSEP